MLREVLQIDNDLFPEGKATLSPSFLPIKGNCYGLRKQPYQDGMLQHTDNLSVDMLTEHAIYGDSRQIGFKGTVNK